jgi:hypothetical protein
MNRINRITQFNSIIEDCENFCVLTRHSELQKEACTKLDMLLADCKISKREAIQVGDEDTANLYLGFECVATCLSAELAMWVFLKEEKPDDAWDKLICAQMAANEAVRAHKGFAHLVRKGEQLEGFEKNIFPPQVFVSAGLIVRHQQCSICGGEYGECQHLVGKPYWGEFCYIVAREFEPNHVALVKNPADKRCRVMAFAAPDGERNRMTWKIEARKTEPSSSTVSSTEIQKDETASDKGLRASARIMHVDSVNRRRS